MRLAFLRGPVLMVVLAVAVVSLGAAQPPVIEKKSTNPADKKPAAEAFPPGTVIGVFESVADAMRKYPSYFLVKPERYKELEDAEKRLQALLARPPRERDHSEQVCPQGQGRGRAGAAASAVRVRHRQTR